MDRPPDQPPPPVWLDPHFARYFRRAKALVGILAREQRWRHGDRESQHRLILHACITGDVHPTRLALDDGLAAANVGGQRLRRSSDGPRYGTDGPHEP